jgi:hypothetical protein
MPKGRLEKSRPFIFALLPTATEDYLPGAVGGPARGCVPAIRAIAEEFE